MIISAFSMEKSSVGRLEMFQCCIWIGSPTHFSKLKFLWEILYYLEPICIIADMKYIFLITYGLMLIFFCCQLIIHLSIWLDRYSVVNGPRYATAPDAINTSPVNVLKLSSRQVILSIQRCFSFPSREIISVALLCFCLQCLCCFAKSLYKENCRYILSNFQILLRKFKTYSYWSLSVFNWYSRSFSWFWEAFNSSIFRSKFKEVCWKTKQICI